MNTWSRAQSVKRFDVWWTFTINFYLSKFGNHRPRGSRNISFFNCHVTSCGHVIAGWRNFSGCSPSAKLPSLPSMVTISFAEVEIWSILIFNVRRRIHMIILLQSMTVHYRRLFWHISYYKVRKSNFITKRDRLLLQSASGIAKYDRMLLQSASDIAKCDN